MQKVRHSFLSTAILIGCIIFCLSLRDFIKNRPARILKSAVQAELASYFETATLSDRKPLQDIGNTAWDLLCVPNHYSTGQSAAAWYFKDKHINLSDFAIADAQMLDAEYGLTFIRIDQKLLLTVPVPFYVHIQPPADKRQACLPIAGTLLSGPAHTGSTKNSIAITRAPIKPL